MPDLAQVDWVMIGIGLAVLVVGWTILKAVFKLTMRVFTLGCVGLVVLAGILGALAYFGS
jgi:hypothetical protein